jgi:hypothetical protein
MAQGGGKYDAYATMVREAAEASAVVVMVFGGVRGTGFSVQGPKSLIAALPMMLRNMANGIEKDNAEIDRQEP